MKTVIVGGVAGGASAAARLRRLDETAEIVLLEKGENVSFANCGLPYYIGDTITDRDELIIMEPEDLSDRFRLDVRIFNEVIGIDTRNKTLHVAEKRTGRIYDETYDYLILAVGATPVIPKISGVESDKVYCVKSVADAVAIKDRIKAEKPVSALVIGGSFIGIEMAENLSNAGLQVTIAEQMDSLMGNVFDFEMSALIRSTLTKHGIDVLTGRSVVSLTDEQQLLKAVLDDGRTVEAGLVVLAAGMRPDTAIAREAGLDLTPRGHIVVDAHMRTSEENIYAVGDAVQTFNMVTGQQGSLQLAGPANRQGRIAADHIAGLDSRYDGFQGSSIIKIFEMTAAATGISEKAAQALGIDYGKVYLCPPNHAGYYPGMSDMNLKLLFENATGRVLGAQIIGSDGCDKRCDVIATVIRLKGTVKELVGSELCYAPPYNSAKDPVNMAGFVAENLLTGKEKMFYWDEVASLPRDGRVTLLDVCTAAEYAAGHIDGFINIPLDELRDRMDMLDRSKPVYLTCQMGLRGHVAARILMQHGYEAYNLSGGYRFYRRVFG